MKNLGISIYPDKSSIEEDLDYIDLAAKYGAKRIFTNLLGLGGKTKETIKEEFKARISHANKLGMQVMVDVAPYIFDELEISYEDLSFFHEIGAYGIRLDENFDGNKESIMSYNPYGLKLELNASGSVGQIENILSFKPKKENILTCHNFYPQKYTGIELDYFLDNNKKIKQHNIEISAFISSNKEEAFGPWDIKEGLPTLEMHRELPIDLQARHLIAIGDIDNIIIANCYASEEEFKSLEKIVEGRVNIKIDKEYQLSQAEDKILYDEEHFVRGDISPYMRRSTMTRVKYKDEEIKPQNTRAMLRGDVVIVNDNYTRYKGELHIVLKDMENKGNKNVIGKIKKEELFLLDYLNSWDKFVIID
nr:MupG family TIM beta-alpha barrel fold protein [Tissierella sp.]